MTKGAEELSLIVNLARDTGKMEQRNSQLVSEVASLRQQLEQLQQQAAEREAVIDRQKTQIARQDERIRELESLVADTRPDTITVGQPATQQVVVVNQYFLLSGEKTTAYVSSLDDDHRMFAGHMLTHTLADGTPRYMLDKVTEMTRLEGNSRQERLAEAIEDAASKTEVLKEIAERPTTVYQSGATHDDKRQQMILDGKVEKDKLIEKKDE
jgi:multidrug efflux pump subunit AcrA (membrane-fusion protein)